MNLIPLSIVYALIAIAVFMLACCSIASVFGFIAGVWDRSRCDRIGLYVFLVAVVGATLYAGAKHNVGNITYPYTDVEIRYLIDAGSYVTNNAIHVAFTRMIAPSSAPLIIDRRRLDQTNDVDWVNFTNTTFAAFNQPQTIQFDYATNYNWIVYTTWTPGPTVQTNGVWHAYWGLDRKKRLYIIPVRTCVRDNDTIVSTPKSVWAAEATTN